MPPENYLVACWNCLGDFDALAAVWCSDDPKNPTKLCPFCLRCFCAASEKYKQDFWREAPGRLREELQTLHRSPDRLGDILIRLKKLTTPQLLEALVEQRASGRKLGELLVERGFLRAEDIAEALRSQGGNPLTDTGGAAYASRPALENGDPAAVLQYLLTLAARKGASDLQLEPGDESVVVRYRIDGFSFRVDPLPKALHAGLMQHLCKRFGLEASALQTPQSRRITERLGDVDFDLVTQTLPTPAGASATIKLVNRATFIKDFSTLGLELEDRVRLLEELRGAFGLLLVSAPLFHGARTTAYSVMSFLVQAQRDVVALESPVQWPLEGARQMDVGVEPGASERALRSALAVHPDVIVLSSVPDAASARLAAQVASSLLVVAVLPAPSAAHALNALMALGVTSAMLSECLVGVLCQRLVRQVCRVCRASAEPPAPQTLAHHGIGPQEAARLQFFKGRGCPSCNRVGYRGRRAIFELLGGAPEVRSALQNGVTGEALVALGVASGMRPLRTRCLDLVRAGITTFDEFTRLKL